MAAESPRIAELRRRVHADPASIAFAQLAEEYRRAGNYADAVKYCRTGLARHPGYLSARVTLGRALIEVGHLDEAADELQLVLNGAPDNLAAIRGMAEIEQRRHNMAGALAYYKRALALARFDPELEETVTRIGRELGEVTSHANSEGLSFEQATSELLSAAVRVPMPVAPTAVPDEAPKAVQTEADRSPAVDALIDFDALLESLGAPDAAPPPAMQMLLSPTVTTPGSSIIPELPANASAIDAFADLERELWAFEHPRALGELDPVDVAVLDELEAWAHVLHSERTLQTA